MSEPREPRRFPRWILLGGALLALLYLPSLATRFDFIDDGNLVYPTKPMPFSQRAGVVWEKIAGNYQHLGPFRPVLWVHWETWADLLQGSELGWRIIRLLWCALAATMLLWLFTELGIPPLAALAAGAVSMWNPYRNEIWTSLTLSEGVAMPYALLALVCSRRALGSRRPALWDLLGAFCVLAALGCKNTFAALVPAQVFLRLAEDGIPLREGIKRHWRRGALLSLTLIAPVVHYIWFKLTWHPGQYTPGGPTLTQLGRLLSGLVGAMSLSYLAIGLVLAVIAQVAALRSKDSGDHPVAARFPVIAWLVGLAQRYRAALGAGVLLLGAGIFIYLPMDAMSGRYTMPAVWGLDLILAILLGGLVVLQRTSWTRASWAALGMGLVIVLAANVGRQQKFASRASLLWVVLEHVERQAPRDAHVAWICGDSLRGGLNNEEGIHFRWHLAARGRSDIRVSLHDENGVLLPQEDSLQMSGTPDLAIWGPAQDRGMASWQERQHFVVPYWAGKRRYECSLGDLRTTPERQRRGDANASAKRR
jgi:hypothetical protein